MPSIPTERAQSAELQEAHGVVTSERVEGHDSAPQESPAREALRILVADDHQIFLRGLKGILEQGGYTIVAEAADGREAVRLASECKPDIAILDIGMPHMNGIEAATEIGKVLPLTKTILLTMHSEDRYVLEALHAGIRGYVLKSRTATEVILAIRDVQRGGIFLSPDVSRAIVDAYLDKSKTNYETLTPREVEVLRLVAEGKTTKEVASILGVSVKTADTHRMNVMHKLDMHSSAELIHYAIRRGLVQP
jgi:two-component system, NarL family, response regulator NreC